MGCRHVQCGAAWVGMDGRMEIRSEGGRKNGRVWVGRQGGSEEWGGRDGVRNGEAGRKCGTGRQGGREGWKAGRE
eukprot:364465-Chlamydomonas_euryale.AAC.1